MMAAWQVDAMWEAESARIWEEMNAPDPYENQMQTAAKSLKEAIDRLSKGTEGVVEATHDLQGTPMEYLVASFTDQLENLICDLRQLQEKYERGER